MSKISILVVFVLLLFPEYEPLDKKKEEYINEDLAEQGNSQMVATTTMRVKGPKQIHKSMKKLIRNELCHIVRPYHKKLAVLLCHCRAFKLSSDLFHSLSVCCLTLTFR